MVFASGCGGVLGGPAQNVIEPVDPGTCRRLHTLDIVTSRYHNLVRVNDAERRHQSARHL